MKTKLKGPWNNEPDSATWTDIKTGYICEIKRVGGGLGHLCGYVTLPMSHALSKKNISSPVLDRLNVHGGITFAAFSEDREKGEGWTIGFDCAHRTDFIPGIALTAGGVYRDYKWVREEVVRLAQQLRALEGA